jgi:hypothetical protein
MSDCNRCGGCRWVCEAHPDRAWIGDGLCQCGAPGMPCPACNLCTDNDPLQMPPGFVDL